MDSRWTGISSRSNGSSIDEPLNAVARYAYATANGPPLTTADDASSVANGWNASSAIDDGLAYEPRHAYGLTDEHGNATSAVNGRHAHVVAYGSANDATWNVDGRYAYAAANGNAWTVDVNGRHALAANDDATAYGSTHDAA